MAVDKLVTIRSRNHHENLVKGLWNHFIHQRDVDFNMQHGSNSIRVHRLVLDVIMSLPDKQRINNASTTTTNNRNNIDGRVSSPSVENSAWNGNVCSLEYLVEFVYKGRVAIPDRKLNELLLLARELKFEMLVEAVESTLKFNSRPRRKCTSDPDKILKDQTDSANESSDDYSVNAPYGANCRTNGGGSRKKSRSSRTQRKDVSPQNNKSPIAEPESDHAITIVGKEGQKLIKKPLKHNTTELADSTRQDQTDNFEKSHPYLKSDRATTVVGKGQRKLIKKPVKSKKTKTNDSTRLEKTDSSTTDRRTLWLASQPLLNCEHCNYETRRQSAFKIHRSKHDPSVVVFRCDVCSTAFLNEKARRRHRMRAHGESATRRQCCPHCDYTTNEKLRFRVHLATHDASVTVLMCDQCSQPYFSAEELERHRLTHKIYSCPHCPFQTPKHVTYYYHLNSKHKVNGYGESVEKRFQCTICNSAFMYASQLRKHNKTHSLDRPHQCQRCSYSCSRSGALLRHVRFVHDRIRPHLCDICGHRAFDKSKLNAHKRSHSGEKPFSCTHDGCGQTFSDRTTLKRHARRHQMDVPVKGEQREMNLMDCEDTAGLPQSTPTHVSLNLAPPDSSRELESTHGRQNTSMNLCEQEQGGTIMLLAGYETWN